MDFQEYLDLSSRTFVQYYRCLPTSCLNKENVDEDGNRVIMPQSALDTLGRLDIEFPMMFKIQNPSTERITHCGVLEFVAEEGFIHIPSWLMAHLGLTDNDIVLVRSTTLPTATFVKLQPHTSDFLHVSHRRELLERNFRKYACVTAGETITVTEGERRYCLDVVEARPADAVCSIDTDCSVDFAPPLDYEEPPPAPEPTGSQGNDEPQQPPRFPGVAVRMDGKPVEQPPRFPGVAVRMDGKPVEQPPAPVPVARQGDQPQQPSQFSGVAVRMDGKPVELPPPTTPSPAPASVPKRKILFGGPSAAGNGSGVKEQKRFAGT